MNSLQRELIGELKDHTGKDYSAISTECEIKNPFWRGLQAKIDFVV